MSEAFIVSVFLALGGGFQDAYTYMVRDHVFANAQTGNVVLMSTHLFGGEWAAALRYLLPLLAFVAGVLVAARIPWRQWMRTACLNLCCTCSARGFLPPRWSFSAWWG